MSYFNFYTAPYSENLFTGIHRRWKPGQLASFARFTSALTKPCYLKCESIKIPKLHHHQYHHYYHRLHSGPAKWFVSFKDASSHNKQQTCLSIPLFWGSGCSTLSYLSMQIARKWLSSIEILCLAAYLYVACCWLQLKYPPDSETPSSSCWMKLCKSEWIITFADAVTHLTFGRRGLTFNEVKRRIRESKETAGVFLVCCYNISNPPNSETVCYRNEIGKEGERDFNHSFGCVIKSPRNFEFLALAVTICK